MNVFINGEKTELSEELSLAELIQRLELTDKRIATELNQEIVPRSAYQVTILKADDRVEIVQAIGGG